MPADWANARDLMMLRPDVAYLNTGSFAPLPRCVFDRITVLRRNLAEEPMDFLLRCVPALLWQARERVAGFVRGDPRRLMFTTNVTAAINVVASSLPLASQGEILLTDHEYITMQWCWERVAERLGLAIRKFSVPTMASDPSEIVDAAASAMTPQTRLFFFSHILSTTGLILPARELCVEARRRGILTVVDGAHAPAFIDLNLTEIPCDFYAGSGHKWLLAPTGTGFLHFGSGNEGLLQPTQVSWGYHPISNSRQLDEPDRFGSTPRLRRFECEGTRDVCPWLALPEAIDFQATLQHDRIRTRMRELTDYVRRRLSSWRGLVLATPAQPSMSGAMTAFCLPKGVNAAVLRRELWEQFRVEVSVIEREDKMLIRVSTHFYNTEDEIERLAEALGKLLPS
jgi:isopenicillin-N epimerase